MKALSVFQFGAVMAAERDRFILWAPVFLGLGIAVYFSLARPSGWLAWASGAVVALIIVWFARNAPVLVLACIAFALVCVGGVVADLRVSAVATPILQKELRGNFTARICRIEDRHDRQRLILDHIQHSRLAQSRTPKQVRVSFRGKTRSSTLKVDTRIKLRAHLYPLPEPVLPGGFDFARHLYFQSIGGVGYATAPPITVAERGRSEAVGSCSGWFADLRQDIVARIKAADLGRAEAMVIALMTGERGELRPETLDNLRASGLAHLLAISGLHIGLIASVLFFGVRLIIALWPWLAVRINGKKAAAVIALMGAGCYLILTGATIPTQRAYLMLAVFLGAVLLDRTAISLRAVALAAFLVLLFHPESLMSASFQLSFAAVTALVAVYESLRGPLQNLRSRAGATGLITVYIAGVALTTLVAGLATTPYAIAHFNQAASYGLIGNLAAVPIMAFAVMPFAVFAFILMPTGLEAFALTLMAYSVEAILMIADWVAHLPGALNGVATPPAYFIPAITLLGLWLCLWRGRIRFWALPGFMMVAVLSFTLPPDKPIVLVSDSGRGIAVFSETREFISRGLREKSLTADRWRRRWDGQLHPAVSKTNDLKWTCDKLACVYKDHRLSIAHISDPRAFQDDCGQVDLIIATIPAPRHCRTRLGVFDRFDFWHHGAHVFYVNETGLRVETVRGDAQSWPWQRKRH